MGRVIGIVVIILVLYAIVTNPQRAANTTSNGLSNLADAGTQITVFFSSVVSDVAGSTGSTTAATTTTGGHTYYPVNGVEAGDGSTPIDR